MKIFLSAGHSQLINGNYTGAMGYLNEHLENIYLVNEVAKLLRSVGHTVDICIIPAKTLANKDAERNYKLSREAKAKYDLAIEIHFNSFDSKAQGTECLYKSEGGKKWAQRINDKLKSLYKGRGLKHRDDLYFLNNTKAVAVMIETCFVDNKSDADLYKANKAKTTLLIAEAIHGSSISGPKPAINKDEVYYRVIAGSYANKANADKLVTDLKAKGFDSFIETYKK